MRDYRGLVAVVTGASSGTGRELARLLHTQGADVVVIGRDAARTLALADELDSPGLTVDHSDLDDVRRCSADLLARFPRIDVLFSNAGAAVVATAPTTDGNEPNLQVNALGPLLLESLLEPAMRAAAAPRIVATSSRSHRGATLAAGDVAAQLEDPAGAPHGRYARAKLAALIEHERRRRTGTIETVDVHPGIVATDFGRYLGRPGAVMKVVAGPVLSSPQHAARILAGVGALDRLAGPYYHRDRVRPASPLVQDPALQTEVGTVVADLLRPFLSGERS